MHDKKKCTKSRRSGAAIFHAERFSSPHTHTHHQPPISSDSIDVSSRRSTVGPVFLGRGGTCPHKNRSAGVFFLSIWKEELKHLTDDLDCQKEVQGDPFCSQQEPRVVAYISEVLRIGLMGSGNKFSFI